MSEDHRIIPCAAEQTEIHDDGTVERWRPVVGWENDYQISDHGRIRSIDRLINDGKGGLRKMKGRILRGYVSAGGYHQINFFRNARYYPKLIHRLILEAFVGPCPEGMECCHNDTDKNNNVIGNLRWDTHSANINDTLRAGKKIGKSKPGETHHMSKLTDEKVRYIRAAFASGDKTYQELADELNVSKGAIAFVVRRVSWQHVT